MISAKEIFEPTIVPKLKKGTTLYFRTPLPSEFEGLNNGEYYYNIYGVAVKIPQLNRTFKIRTDECIDENWTIHSVENINNELLLNYSWSVMDPYHSVDDLLDCEIAPLQLAIEEQLERDGIADFTIEVTLTIEEA